MRSARTWRDFSRARSAQARHMRRPRQRGSGQRGGFVSSGPYRFTRNPQYVGDIVFFVGVGVIANSVFLWIAHVLLILGFVVAPLTEEPWLEEQYGDAYREYRRRVPRFL